MTKLEPLAAEPQSDRLIDQAYARLRHDIISCSLEPGLEVTEAQLALRCGFGKAATRAALLRLSQEKLVTALPRRGYQVTPITLRDVCEIFQLRALLEPEAVRLAVPSMDADRLAELDAICAAGYVPGDRESEERFLRANREFHSSIIHGCGNERLADLVDSVVDQMQRLFHIGLTLSNRREDLRGQHAALLKAVQQRDSAAAAEVTNEHIETMRRMVMDSIMRSPSIMQVPLSARSALQ